MRFPEISRNPTIPPAPTRPVAGTAEKEAFNGNLLLILVAAVTVLGYFVYNAVLYPADLTSRFTIDDSFYYFETAWQTKQHGFVTFDGLHPTNGVHFLWFAIVLAAAFVAPGKIALLYSVYTLSLLLVAAVYAAIWRVGTLIGDRSRFLTLLMALVWSVVLIDRQHLMVVGMESTLHMAVLWGCLIAGLTALIRLRTDRRSFAQWYLLFSLGTVLVTWTRLDAALFSFGLYIFVTSIFIKEWGFRNRFTLKFIALSLAIITAGALVQIGFFYFAGGTVVPISALVKQAGLTPEAVGSDGARYMSVLFPFATFISENDPRFWAAEAAFFGALLIYVIMRAAWSEGPRRDLFGLTAAIGITVPVYTALVGGIHVPFWRWYLAPVFLFYILAAGFAFQEAFGRWNDRLITSKIAAALAGVILVPTFLFIARSTYIPLPLYLTRAQAGIFLNDTVEKNARLASFNSGQLAFLADRPMINLDGLVNSHDYFREVFNRPEKIIEYLRKNDVRYIVDYDFYWATHVILQNTTVKYSFDIPGDYKQRTIFVRELKRQ